MNDIYDVLELCLQEVEKGADVETVLSRYPDHAGELRPILEASVQAKSLAVPDPTPDVVRRNRAKVLQQAAQIREAQAGPARRLWSVPLRRVLVSLAVIGVLFISSTNLVRAASTTLPGDNLYPVKRTWEDVRVLLTFNMQAREALEIEHENERLEELNDLFAEGRSVKVDFAGMVTSQNGDLWLVSKVPVLVSAQTDLGGQSLAIGDAIRVRGFTQADGTVLAERVDLLPADVPLPDLDDESPSLEQEKPETEPESGEDNSGKGSGNDVPKTEETQAPEDESNLKESSLDGNVDSINGSELVVNGQSIDIAGAEIKGTPKVGAAAKVEGYYDANGVFIVTKIEFQSTSSESGSGSESNDNSGSDDGGSSHEDGGDDSGGGNSGSGGASGGGGDD